MSQFGAIVLLAVAGYGGYRFLKAYLDLRHILFAYLSFTFLFLILFALAQLIFSQISFADKDIVIDWILMFTATGSLASAASLVREFRPVFARFPKVFTLVPFLLVLLYPFVMETLVMKTWILSMYQGSALIISLLIVGYRLSEDGKYLYSFLGLCALTLVFVAFLFPSSIIDLPLFVWTMMVAFGLLVFVLGYEFGVLKQEVEAEETK